MQLKAFTASIAALSITAAHAAAVKRITLDLGSIDFPSVTIDPKEFGIQTAVSGLLDQLQASIVKTTALFNQLNEVSDAASKSILARTLQAATIIAQAQDNAQKITQNVNNAVKLITKALPAKPSPTAPSNGATATPASDGTQALIQSLTSIATKAEDVLSQTKNLTATANSQFTELSKQLSQQLTATTSTAVPLLGQATTQTTAQVSAIVKKLVTNAGGSLTSISNAAQSALTTAQQAVASVAQTTSSTAQDTITGLATRIANAQIDLQPVVIIGFTPKITF